MTKQQMIDYINEHFDWFECMQVGLGHDSWWYTNRSPEECINVKVHAWIDSDDVLSKLTAKEREIISTLGLDLNEYLNDMIWGDFGLVEMAREDLLEELKEKYNVESIEYGGRQGGWMAVIYDWSDVYDDYDDPDYSYKQVREFYQTIKKAVAEHEKVTGLVLERKRSLERYIEDPETYLDSVSIWVEENLDMQQQAQRVLALGSEA